MLEARHAAHALAYVDPVDPWHVDVQDRQIRRVLLEVLECLFSVIHQNDLVPVEGEQHLDQGAVAPVIIGDQDRGSRHCDQVYAIGATEEKGYFMGLPSDTYLIAFYPVHDLAATRDFYGRDLGLALVRDQGACLIFRAPAGGHLGFCQHDETEAAPRQDRLILTFVTTEVDAVYQRLRNIGAETEARPAHAEAFGIYRFFARDPDGYRIEIQRFDRPLDGPASS